MVETLKAFRTLEMVLGHFWRFRLAGVLILSV
jgi:hypothetical protein